MKVADEPSLRKRDLVEIILWATAIVTAYAVVYWLVMYWTGTFGAW